MPRKLGSTATSVLSNSAKTSCRCAVDAGEVTTARSDRVVAGVGAVVLEKCVGAADARCRSRIGDKPKSLLSTDEMVSREDLLAGRLSVRAGEDACQADAADGRLVVGVANLGGLVLNAAELQGVVNDWWL